MPPQRKRGQFFFERRFLFSKDDWISFQKDFRIFHLVFQRDVDLVFTDNWTFWIGLTQGYDLVFLSDFGLVFPGSGPWFFFGFLDLVFLSDFGLVFLWIVGLGFSLDRWTRFFFGFLDLVFSFGRWIL
jgi:hypothetical protein